MAKKETVFQNSNHLSAEELLGYIKGNLSEGEIRQVERHLVDCSLCADALEGVQKLNAAGDLLRIPFELRKLARKRRSHWRRPLFSRMDIVATLAVFFLILFLVAIAIVFFLKK